MAGAGLSALLQAVQPLPTRTELDKYGPLLPGAIRA
jgi:hypothetical protein